MGAGDTCDAGTVPPAAPTQEKRRNDFLGSNKNWKGSEELSRKSGGDEIGRNKENKRKKHNFIILYNTRDYLFWLLTGALCTYQYSSTGAFLCRVRYSGLEL